MQISQLCPSLLYYRFSKATPEVSNCVSIVDFEKDMQKLLELGYQSVSISRIVAAKENKEPLPTKSFCVIFQGGYEDNYSIAFPVIKRLNLHVSIFIEPNMVGYDSHPEDPDFIPRFTWQQAKEMQNSGLVSIYAFWHPSENDNDNLCEEVERRFLEISNNLEGSISNTSFYINITQFEKERIAALKQVGIKSYIIAFWLMNSEKIDSGAIPYTCMDQGANILDVIEEFNQKCSSMIKQEEDTFKTNVEVDSWDNDCYETIELPVDKKPLIRNFLRHAFPLSVIGASRRDKAELFILYEYIDVIFRPWYHWFDYDNSLYDSWDVIECNKISRDIIRINKLNILDCIINSMYNGYYCDLWMDVYYIPGKAGYKEEHFAHNLLIYGYDRNTDKFKTLTYTKRGQYEELEVESNNLLKACSTNYFITANFIKINKESKLIYSREELCKRLQKYIRSEYNYSISSKYNKYDSNQSYNFMACESFPEYIKTTGIKEHKIYIVALYGFLEHKKCMGWRLKTIIERENINDVMIDEFEEMSRKTLQLGVNLAMKYNFTQDESVLSRLTDMLQTINNKELQAIKQLLELLNKQT